MSAARSRVNSSDGCHCFFPVKLQKSNRIPESNGILERGSREALPPPLLQQRAHAAVAVSRQRGGTVVGRRKKDAGRRM
jgi:hypothetical protein